jgi:hypothetical protein
MTTSTGPATAAGRALLEMCEYHASHGDRWCSLLDSILAIEAEAARPLTVERLAKALFLYRTSTNVPLPIDYWERQSSHMVTPFLDEAAAILRALEADRG